MCPEGQTNHQCSSDEAPSDSDVGRTGRRGLQVIVDKNNLVRPEGERCP